jgi:hypothetical protein
MAFSCDDRGDFAVFAFFISTRVRKRGVTAEHFAGGAIHDTPAGNVSHAVFTFVKTVEHFSSLPRQASDTVAV